VTRTRSARALGLALILVLSGGVLATTAAGPAPTGAQPVAEFGATQRKPAPAVKIVVLSSRADLVSGGEALVRVILRSGNYSSINRIDLDGRAVTRAFALRRDGRYTGLVSGLTNGANDLRVRLRSGAGARMTLTNHPSGGALFSGRHVRPWQCNAGARNRNCARTPTYQYYYVPIGVDPEALPGMIGSSPGSDPYFLPYDRTSPPAPALIATTTTDEGRTLPFIVRLETGSINRGQYQIAVLFDPDKPWTLARPQSAWNRKLFMVGAPIAASRTKRAAHPACSTERYLAKASQRFHTRSWLPAITAT